MMRSLSVILALSLTCMAIAYDEADFARLLQTNMCIGCDLSGADLSNKDLKSADLSRANLTNVSFFGCHLSGIDLSFAQLRGADFRNAIIVGDVYLLGFYDERPDLRNADLRGANFSNAVFRNVRIDGAIIDETTTLPVGYPVDGQVAKPYQLLEEFEINTSCPTGTEQTYRGCE